MKNKLVFTVFFYIIGIILAYTEIISVSTLILTSLVTFFALYITLNKLKNLIYYIIVICLSIIIGFLITKNNLNTMGNNFYNKTIDVKGTVIKKSIDESQIIIKADKICYDEKEINNVDKKIIINIRDENKINEGTTIKVNSQFLQPIPATNRYVFDYKKYLMNNKIQGTMFVSNDDIKIIKEEGFLYKIRNKTLVNISNLIDNSTDDKNSKILKSVIFGETDYLEGDFLKDIRRTGIAHIFAVSGLHIGIFILVFSFIFKLLGLNVNKSKITIVLFLWMYGFAIGFPVSILRALVIYSILVLGEVLYRKNSPFNSISLAALILLIYNPLWAFDVGFQLSFTTTLVIYLYIAYISPKFKNKYISKILLIPFIQIGIIPILAYYFNYISIFSFLGNLILVPLFSIILSFCFIGIVISLILLPVGEIILSVTNIQLNIFNYILDIIFNIPILGIRIFTPQITFLFFYYILVLFLVYNFNKNKTDKLTNFLYMSIFIFFVIHVFIPLNFNRTLEVSFLDVGQGNASIISYKNKIIMIDAGGDIYSNYNKGEEEIPDYLIKKGIFKIDLAFISHYHEDHYCSIEEVSEIAEIEDIFVYDTNNQIPNISLDSLKALNSNNKIIIDNDLKIDILWPEEGFYSQDENDNSLVILITFNETRILYTGDISKEVEKDILEKIKNSIDIILVPHHGSSTSSSKEFIEKTNPRNAVLSYGKNFYGIPSSTVLERYENNLTNIYSTFKDGEIWAIIEKDGNYRIQTFRDFKSDKISLFEILILEMFIFLFLIYFQERDIYYEEFG